MSRLCGRNKSVRRQNGTRPAACGGHAPARNGKPTTAPGPAASPRLVDERLPECRRGEPCVRPERHREEARANTSFAPTGDTMFTNIHIKKHERGLLFRRGDFVRLLRPGTYRFWDLLSRTKVAVVSTLETNFKHPLLDVLLLEPSVQDELLVLDLADGERAIVWKDERLAYVLGPGRHALWLASGKLRVERFDISQFRFEHPKLSLILQNSDALKFLEGVMVDANQEVLLYRDGVLIGRLSEGLHVFWKGTGKVAWKTIDRREQVIDVAGQEILTSDKVTLRVNLLVTYQVIDPVRAVTAVSDAAQTLYREAQLVLRKAIGTQPLDALLADKGAIGAQVR